MDPLEALPAEIVLRILEFTPTSSVASLTTLNRTWHDFIDHLHQDAIYGSHSKTEHPPGAKDFSFIRKIESFDQFFQGVSTWKDLCKRRTLLARNYSRARPHVTDNFMVPLLDANRVWRFRTDLKRRIFICTSQDGGLTVTDMDGKGRLWHLDHDDVPPFAHLEYDDGLAIWSTLGDGLEVWKTDETELGRGGFRRVAVLDCPLHNLRGFHLAFNTLCVVGNDGQGLVYDMRSEPPRLRLTLDIKEGAVGHLCQAEEVVMYSMGTTFHVHDKVDGALLGALEPEKVERIYHIIHPTRPALGESGSHQISVPPLSSYIIHSEEADDVLDPIEVQEGPYPFAATDQELRMPVERDEWGAGLISGDLMVGISKAGRVLVCSNWRAAIKSDEKLRTYTSIIECENNDENFTLGGWLSIRDNRVLFEILDKVYVVSLNEEGAVPTASQKKKQRPSWCFFSALNPMLHRRLQSGISMMQLWDDCIMTTCWVGDDHYQ